MIDFDKELGGAVRKASGSNSASLVDFLGAQENFPAVFTKVEKEGETTILHGTRFDSNEAVRVVLRETKAPSRAAQIRKNLEKVNKNTKSGGVMLVEKAHRRDDGVYEAFWLTTMAATPKGTAIAKRMVNVNFFKVEFDGEQSDRAALNVMKVDNAVSVDSADKLKEKLIDMLQRNQEGTFPYAVVRIIDNAGKAFTLHVIPRKGKDGGQHPDQTVNEFMSDAGAKIDSWMRSGDAKLVEVIPGMTVYFGRDSVQSMVEGSLHYGETLKQMFTSLGERMYEDRAYIPFWITVRTGDNGRAFATDALRPVVALPEVRTAAELNTPNHQVEVERRVSAKVGLPHIHLDDGSDLSDQDMADIDQALGGDAESASPATANP